MKNRFDSQKRDIKAFLTMTVAHPHLTTTIENLLLAINQVEQGDLIFLFGPTGVGKTTLGSKILKKLNKELRIELGEKDPSIMPAVLMEAPHPDAPKFSWKEYYRRSLISLNEPLIGKKHKDSRCSAYTVVHQEDRTPGHELRMAFENSLKYRKVKILIIDEAQHIARGSSNYDSLQGQLNYLKSLANLTETIIILVGTYDLLAFRNLSGQLSRRSTDVHFPRYNFENADERQMFYNVIESFVRKLPIPHELDLSALNEEFYVGSAGCVGILSSWLKKALKLAVNKKDSILTYKHIENTARSEQQLLKITEELENGEALLKPDINAQAKIRARLGLLSPSNLTAIENTAAKPVNPITLSKRVGIRKPFRDPVGNNQ